MRNVIEWLLIMAPGEAQEPIRADTLPPEIGAIAPPVLRWEKSAEIMGLPLREARELFASSALARAAAAWRPWKRCCASS